MMSRLDSKALYCNNNIEIVKEVTSILSCFIDYYFCDRNVMEDY